MRKILAAVAVVFLAAGVAQAQGRGASFPTADDLKTKVGFDDEQLKKAEPIIAEYTPKVKDAADKAKDAADKKAAYGEVRTIRTEGLNKLKEICKDDDQKAKMDEAFGRKKKSNNN
ncbi:MAG TPA: hypothetical protein VKU80_01030 [Planctomycetota bacterium]|nr:hypothetical protein [Planctomycetota bacterium]